MSAALLLLLTLSPRFVVSYNVDTRHPVVYEDPESRGPSYFGYSVSLSSGRNGVSPPSVYRCTATSQCQALEIYDIETTKPGWLGASMATGETSDFTVCAPRTLLPYPLPSIPPGQPYYFLDLHGVCYYLTDAKGNTLSRDYDAKIHNNYYFNIAHGFSINYASINSHNSNQGSKMVTRIIGHPGLSGVDITHNSRRIPEHWNVESGDSKQGLSKLGYSVSSGYYFGSNQLLFVAGAPAWSRKGMVTIFEPFQLNSNGIQIHGSVLGEYFGASLATGDFDGDGRDDLAVGAPHWGELDFGRVYTYHSRIDGQLELGRTLRGKVGKGQFGYTLAAADLDLDKFSDLVVGAPWEESGAVHVYYGRSDFGKENPSAQIIQTIKPSEFKRNYPIQRFGFSLSHPVDVDGNGYPDLAIGAYKSGHAVVLRGRPVVRTKIELFSYPATLQNFTQRFVVSVCVTYDGNRAPESQALSFGMTVDAQHNRAKGGSLITLDGLFNHRQRSCSNKTISLITSETSNVIDPIVIDVTYNVKEGTNGGKIDAVLNRKSVNEIVAMTVFFKTGCKGGPICDAQLSVTASFEGVEADDAWVVGSGDIKLNVTVTNEKDPAYLTRLMIVMPPGINLRIAVGACHSDKIENTLTLICNAGNPLGDGETKRFIFDLDMDNVETRPDRESVLSFNVTRSTHSRDNETNSNPLTIVNLKTKNVAHLNLTGVTDKKTLDYARTVEKSEVLIRHTYHVQKFGPSPITRAELTIDVPASTEGRKKMFLNITDPKLIDGSGRTHVCSFDDARPDDRMLLRRRREKMPSDDHELTNGAGKGEATVGQTTEKTIYLNCSTKGVTCARLVCGFELTRTNQNVATIALEMTFDAGAFYASGEDSLTVKFHTNASVDISSPYISDPTDIRNRSAGVATMIYNIPEQQKLAGWILPASVILGILLFCILAIILFRVGFFKRSKKLENAKAKETELMLKADDAEDVGNRDGDLYN